MCQLFAAVKEQRLYSVNCHLHTESADFLGGLRPVRHHDEVGACCVGGGHLWGTLVVGWTVRV